MTLPLPRPEHSVPSTRNRQRLRARDWPHPPKRDPHVRVIARLTEVAGADMSVIASSSRPWASATFVGAQHRIIVRFSGEGAHASATRFAEDIPDVEFTISGHIVADACVDEWRTGTDTGEAEDTPSTEAACSLTLRITVLTVEDW